VRDQIFAYATQEELGLEEISSRTVIDALREIPFWPAMRTLARYQRDLWPVQIDQDGQRELLHRWYGDGTPFVEKAESFLGGSHLRVLFTEQQLFALQKLALLNSAEGDVAEELSSTQYLALMIAMAAVPGTVLHPLDELAESTESEGVIDDLWFRLFVGHGGLVGKGNLAHEFARQYHLYQVLANSPEAQADVDACPIDTWLAEVYGLSFIEMQGIAFGLYAGSHVADTTHVPAVVDVNYFATTKLASKAEAGLDALSAEPDWYRSIFRDTEDDSRRLAFDITPFFQRPAIRIPGGAVMPIAPRALEVWLGASGAYYRLFDIARSKGDVVRNKFQRLHGRLVERHVQKAVAAAFHMPESNSLWVPGAVHDAIVYQTSDGERETPDVAIDLGQDLVLIEVTGGRPTQKSLVDADLDAIKRDIDKLLENKIRQLGDRIRDLQDRPETIPGVEMPHVNRIWPIVVSSEALFQTPTLWEYLRRDALMALNQAKVQPLTLLDLEELEHFIGLAQQSGALIPMLESKTSEMWQERDFKSWYDGAGQIYGVERSPFMQELFEAAMETMLDTIFTEDQRRDYHDRRAQTAGAGGTEAS
jgi:hypothetical protein